MYVSFKCYKDIKHVLYEYNKERKETGDDEKKLELSLLTVKSILVEYLSKVKHENLKKVKEADFSLMHKIYGSLLISYKYNDGDGEWYDRFDIEGFVSFELGTKDHPIVSRTRAKKHIEFYVDLMLDFIKSYNIWLSNLESKTLMTGIEKELKDIRRGEFNSSYIDYMHRSFQTAVDLFALACKEVAKEDDSRFKELKIHMFDLYDKIVENSHFYYEGNQCDNNSPCKFSGTPS